MAECRIPGGQCALPNIFLFGLPGVGKTFCGESLARQLGYCFHDGDQWLPDDLRESLKKGTDVAGQGFTEHQRDRYVAEIARCIGAAKDLERREVRGADGREALGVW
eukprot:Skav205065  [mRNA]  locus=scaffold142:320857:323888:+ [translate_table: standard]